MRQQGGSALAAQRRSALGPQRAVQAAGGLARLAPSAAMRAARRERPAAQPRRCARAPLPAPAPTFALRGYAIPYSGPAGGLEAAGRAHGCRRCRPAMPGRGRYYAVVTGKPGDCKLMCMSQHLWRPQRSAQAPRAGSGTDGARGFTVQPLSCSSPPRWSWTNLAGLPPTPAPHQSHHPSSCLQTRGRLLRIERAVA